MREVKSFNIQVVPETFLKAVEKGTRNESMEKIKSMSICEWGSDPLTRIPLEEEGPKERVINLIFFPSFQYSYPFLLLSISFA
jgi:hypothetical protein